LACSAAKASKYGSSTLVKVFRGLFLLATRAVSSTQQARLLQRLDQDDIATQGQLRDWLKQEMGISYSQPGISVLLSRLKVKLKTGRPVNVRKDVVGETTFKKTSVN
jgi:transposase